MGMEYREGAIVLLRKTGERCRVLRSGKNRLHQPIVIVRPMDSDVKGFDIRIVYPNEIVPVVDDGPNLFDVGS